MPSDFLKDFLFAGQFAEEIERDERTVERWMAEPDGLPYTWMGNRRLIHIPTAREWLMRRMRQRNPRSRRSSLNEKRAGSP
jgi:hypothetical protein